MTLNILIIFFIIYAVVVCYLGILCYKSRKKAKDYKKLTIMELLNKYNKKRNIYNKYHEYSVDMEWLDDETVELNGTKLNIHRDYYIY